MTCAINHSQIPDGATTCPQCNARAMVVRAWPLVAVIPIYVLAFVIPVVLTMIMSAVVVQRPMNGLGFVAGLAMVYLVHKRLSRATKTVWKNVY